MTNKNIFEVIITQNFIKLVLQPIVFLKVGIANCQHWVRPPGCWGAVSCSVMPLGTLHHQELFCGCICIEKAVDFYRSPSLHARPGYGLVPDSDWRAFCILETTEDNHGMPQKLSGGQEGKQDPKLNP